MFHPKNNYVLLLSPKISSLHQDSVGTYVNEVKVRWSWPPNALSFFLREMRPSQTHCMFQCLYSINSLLYEERQITLHVFKRYNFYIFHMPGILSQSFLPPNGFLVDTNIFIILTFFSFFFISFQSCLFLTEKNVKDCLKWSIFFSNIEETEKKSIQTPFLYFRN